MDDFSESMFDDDLDENTQHNEEDNQDESSEIDDILSDLSSDDDADEDSDSESNDEQVTSEVNQKPKKPSRWKRKINYLTQEKEAKERELQAARREAELARKEAEEQRNFVKMLFSGQSPEQAQNESFAEDKKPTKREYSEEDISAIVQRQLGEMLNKQSEQSKIAGKWVPQIQRIEKELAGSPQKLGAFKSWFNNYRQDVDRNTDKKMLLSIIGNLEYAAETLYAVENSNQLRGLSLDDKIGVMYKVHADIAEKRKKQTSSSKSVALTKQTGASMSKKAKTIMDMSDEEFYKLRTGRK